ncbi:MBL fold metallo-hydrolase [Methanocella sp. MCL-LM]|uniref:MBL fold metallo-hydrolase n=1 Tax=Methanocella sp. MCL-LM TaxID=3412035 RepID=UPI003C73E0C4
MKVINVNGVFYDSNAYLLDAKRKTLVDAGIDGSRMLKSLPEDLELIILTHCHYDHVAAVPEIVKATGAKVAMHEADVPFIKSRKINCSSMFGSDSPALKVDIVLKDGDEIDLGDQKLRVIHTPGHTPGSICLYEPVSKAMFTGDTVFEEGGFGRTDIGGNPEHMLSSLAMLTRFDVSTLYPGHGNIVAENASEALQTSLKSAKFMLMI